MHQVIPRVPHYKSLNYPTFTPNTVRISEFLKSKLDITILVSSSSIIYSNSNALNFSIPIATTSSPFGKGVFYVQGYFKMFNTCYNPFTISAIPPSSIFSSLASFALSYSLTKLTITFIKNYPLTSSPFQTSDNSFTMSLQYSEPTCCSMSY